jgi:hypothetical protein
MGNVNISIRLVGCHHNKASIGDANRMAAEFVQKLLAAGHTVYEAKVAYGNEDDISRPTVYLDDRDAIEGVEQKPRCSKPTEHGPCRLVTSHEGGCIPPVRWERP